MIQNYPDFSLLNYSHRNDVKVITSKFEPYSDFDFTSLASWNTDNLTGISILNGNLVLRMSDYLTQESLFSILGENDMDETLKSLLSDVPELKLVPEAVIRKIKDKGDFIITEDPDNSDYIYSVEKIAALAGGELKKKRNKAHQVANELGLGLTTFNATVLSSQDKTEILNLFNKWAKQKNEAENDAFKEYDALSNLLDSCDDINLVVTIVRLDGELAGFSINELIDDKYAICHFEKALPIHVYIYTFLANQAAKALLNQGAKYMNWEQDLGLPGLRKSKSSYGPDFFLKKYTVTSSDSKAT